MWTFDAGDHIAALAWLPDGRQLAVGPSEGNITVLDRATGSVRLTLPPHALGNCALSASRFAPLLATAGQDGKARIFSSDTGALLRELSASKGECDWCEHAEFSPDGKLFATSASRLDRNRRASLRTWRARIDYCRSRVAF